MSHPSCPNPKQTLSAAIWRTVTYYDMLDFPLTRLELWYFLEPNEATRAGFVTLETMSEALCQAELAKQLRVLDDYVVLRGRENLIRQRESALPGQEFWPRVRRMVGWMHRLPFVRMIAVSGTLALERVGPQSDIDLFIVAAPSRLWLVRLLCKVLTMVFGLHRHDTKTYGRFCLNHLLTDDQMALDHQNLYTARLFSHLVVVYGMTPYWEFMQANRWIGNYVARYPWPNFPPFGVYEESGWGGWLKRMIESVLSGRVGVALETWLKNKQLAHIERDDRRLASSAQVVTTDQCLRFHLEAKEPVALAKFAAATATPPDFGYHP